MNETGGKAERDKRRDPRGRAQLRGDRAKDSISIIGAGFAIRFDFKQRQQQNRQRCQEKQYGPRSNIQGMEPSANRSARRRRFSAWRPRREPGRDEPVLRSPDYEEQKQATRLKGDPNHQRNAYYI